MHQLKNKTKLYYKEFKENIVFKAWCTAKRKMVFPERSWILAAPRRTWKPELILLCKPVLGLHVSHLELLVQLIHSFIKEPVFKPHLRRLLGVSKLPRYIISPKWPHSVKRQSLSKNHRNSRQQTERLKPRGRNFKRQLSRCVGDWQRESNEGEADWKQIDFLQMQFYLKFDVSL